MLLQVLRDDNIWSQEYHSVVHDALSYLCECCFVGLGIILDGDLGSHAPHGMDPSAVAGLDQQQTVGQHAGLSHGHYTPAAMLSIFSTYSPFFGVQLLHVAILQKWRGM